MELLNTHPIKKSDLGFHGNLFGGKLLSWIDSAAAGYAMQLCDTPRMVTVSIDNLKFMVVQVTLVIPQLICIWKLALIMFIQVDKH
jgi:acyl-CoA thioesterase YciA